MTEDATLTIAEKYISATHTSNLRCEADTAGQVDPIIAAGMSRSRIGMSLLRLHSEYDGTPKPRKMTDAAIEAYAVSMDKVKDQTATHKQNLVKAHREAEQWYIHELRLMLGRMKSLPAVREQLTLIADHFCMDHPQEVAVGVLVWWLDSVCGMCHGAQRGHQVDASKLSIAVCPACRGGGKRVLPYGEAGRKLEDVINEAIGMARASLKKRLRGC